MYNKNLLLNILCVELFKPIDEEGNVLIPSNAVYSRIVEEMLKHESHITEKHVYTILKNNRSGIYDLVLKAYGSAHPNITLNESNITFNESTCTSESNKFQLIISVKDWTEMQPERKMYKGRRFLKLKTGKWTHIVSKKIWEQQKLPCAYTFKSCKVSIRLNVQCFAFFKGNCNECGAILIGKMFHKPPKGKDVIFECTLSNFKNDVKHIRKRQLKGYLREKIASKLINEKKEATIWRNEEAKALMNVGDPMPPILYTSEVLRKAKQEQIDKELELISNDPYKNLQYAKYNICMNKIHAIGLDPFYCMYWSMEQLNLYKINEKSNDSSFLVDASGGFAKKLILPNDTLSQHLFLYQCMSVSKGKSIPAFQMISTKQDAAIISYFFLEIRRAGAPIPKLVITDFGRAILVAASRIFANCSDLKSYLEACYNILIIKDTANPCPSTYLRLDVSHFIAMVSRWECLRNKNIKVRQLYIRCIAQAYKMTSIEDLTYLLRSLLVVAFSEEIGRTDNDEILPSDKHLRNVNNIIKGQSVENVEENKELLDEEHLNNEENNLKMEDLPDSWVHWSNSIAQEAKDIAQTSKNGDVLNAYFEPQIAEKICELMNYLPLWTNTMSSHFKINCTIASSSVVESIFSDYKNRAFKGSLPLRVG